MLCFLLLLIIVVISCKRSVEVWTFPNHVTLSTFPSYYSLLLPSMCLYFRYSLLPPCTFCLISFWLHSHTLFSSSFLSLSIRRPTTVSWQLWRCWGSWRSALWPGAWWIGLVSKLPSSSFSRSRPGQPFMCGQRHSLVLSGNTSSKSSLSKRRC